MQINPNVILLDLNYTFVQNSNHADMIALCGLRLKDGGFLTPEEEWRQGKKAVEREIYRNWLVPLLHGKKVILITARKDRFQEMTLQSIKQKSGLVPDEAHFKPAFFKAPVHAFKPWVVKKHLFKTYGSDPDNYFGLESNESTRNAYAQLGIRSCRVDPKVQWKTLPMTGERPVQAALL